MSNHAAEPVGQDVACNCLTYTKDTVLGLGKVYEGYATQGIICKTEFKLKIDEHS